jgi:protein TonB
MLQASEKELALYAPKPVYPLYARQHRWQGDGVFLLRIRPDGTVSSVEVLKSTGYRMLDESAVAAYRQWRFRPGMDHLRIPLTFKM